MLVLLMMERKHIFQDDTKKGNSFGKQAVIPSVVELVVEVGILHN